jgi:uncharacterized protein (TIGR02001 family)
MKLKTLMAALVAATALSGAAFAGDTSKVEWSGNVAITSDYVFRGVSQSDSDPVVQGGIDGKIGNFYMGVWGSGIETNNTDAPSGASSEFDVYAGWTPEAYGFNWDLGAIYYWYPNSDNSFAGEDLSFFEVHAGASRDFGPVTAGLNVYYSPEYSGDLGDAWYSELSLGTDINDWLSLSAAVGYQTIEDAVDYTTWNAGATFHLEGFDIDARYHDTDDHDLVDTARGSLTIKRGF